MKNKILALPFDQNKSSLCTVRNDLFGYFKSFCVRNYEVKNIRKLNTPKYGEE